jgi:hypothetical protein
MTSPLASALNVASDRGLSKRVGTVATVTATEVTVATSGGILTMTSRLSSYAPVVGHVVLVLVDDSGTAVVAGRLVNP